MKKVENVNDLDVMFLVLYDISDEYTRRSVVTYLLREGCLRIQRSVFMGNLPYSRMMSIAKTLKETQAFAHNEDSYIILPLRKESVDAMVVCGDRCNIDMILRRQNVVFL